MTQPAFDLDRIGGRRALRALVDEVVAAGEEALRLYRSGAGADYERKPDRSPVTEADRRVEQRLRAFCARQFPEVGFVGEETAPQGTAEAASRFVVDPIDGTRAFIRGIPTWSILLGLEDEGGPAVGVALMPAAGDLFVAVRGDGAEGNGRPLHVSAVDSLDDALVCHGNLEQFTDSGAVDVLPRLATGTYTQRGFSDFDGYRQLLFGRADAMIDPGVQAWDVCAAAVLVREAGGRLTSLRGEETIYGDGALASNGRVHEALVALVDR